MNWADVVAGALLVAYPYVYSRQMSTIHRKITARGGDVEEFEQRMNRPWLRASMWLAPVAGVVLIVVGLVG